MLIINRSSWG